MDFERSEILKSIQESLVRSSGNEELTINENTTIAECEDWDSLAHFELVVSLQNAYRVRFAAADIRSWQSVTDIINTVLDKVKA